ncbi:MAG: HEAT repeat domain-containing protein [Deltaproteobacteria bacterium]|nr:HEAT repeat domain-containing protein [Deltaproteobacteria bacterium]
MSHDMLDNLRSADVDLQREGAFQAAEARQEEAVPLLVALLQSSNLGVQEAADHALRKIGGRRAVEGVLPLLRSDHPPVRNLAMDLLRALGGEHLDLLLPLLKDEDPDVRIFMSDILGATDNVLAVSSLCEALLRDPEVNVRYQAAVSLGNLARPEAVKSLNQALDDDEWVQFAVIEALMKIRDDSSINAFARALDRSSELVGSMIIDALGEMGNIKAAPMLLKRLDSSDAALRNKVLRAIVRIMGGKSLALLAADERVRVGRYLLSALDDEDAEVQDSAMVGLGYVGDNKAMARILDVAGALDPDRDLERVGLAVDALVRIGALDELGKALLCPNEGAAQIAALVLERIGTPEAVAMLIHAFASSERDMQRSLAAGVARVAGEEAKGFFLDVLKTTSDGTILKQSLFFLGTKLRCPDCVEAILAHLSHPYHDVKEAALDAAVAVGSEPVARYFQSMSTAADSMSRLMGLYGLGRIDVRAHSSELLRGLSDESADVRKICLEALGSMAHEPRIFSALLGLARDEVPEVRLALVETMGRVCSDEAWDFLCRALKDEDDWVRIRAVEALADCTFSQGVPAIIGLLEDRNQLVVLKALSALGRMGGQAAFRALMATLDHEDPEIQAAAEQALDVLQAHSGEVC